MANVIGDVQPNGAGFARACTINAGSTLVVKLAGTASWSAIPGRNGTLFVEYSLTLEGDDWTPCYNPDNDDYTPFELPTQGRDVTGPARLRVTAATAEGEFILSDGGDAAFEFAA